jgi:hypothetical protein
MPAKKKNGPKYPVREWWGKYSAWVSIMKGPSVLTVYNKSLERFFEMFPGRVSLEQFTSLDVADYHLMRTRAGYPERTVDTEINHINQFWRWLTIDHDLPFHSIGQAYVNSCNKRFKNYKRKNNYSLVAILKLLEECQSVRLKRIILGVMQGGRGAIRSRKLREELRNATQRAGLVEFGMQHLRLRTVARLSREIVQAYCQQILDTLPPEPEPNSHTLATVKQPALNEGATVSDGNGDSAPIGGVLQQ